MLLLITKADVHRWFREKLLKECLKVSRKSPLMESIFLQVKSTVIVASIFRAIQFLSPM